MEGIIRLLTQKSKNCMPITGRDNGQRVVQIPGKREGKGLTSDYHIPTHHKDPEKGEQQHQANIPNTIQSGRSTYFFINLSLACSKKISFQRIPHRGIVIIKMSMFF